MMSEVSTDPISDLLDALEEALPIKRQANVEGWPRPVWIWRLELAQLVQLNQKRKLLADGERGIQEYFLELLACCLGDENAPGAFATARGRNWLRRNPMAVIQLGEAARDFNELGGPAPDRKKKSPEPCPSSSLPEPSESDTLDD
jgi:hypothetical protein